MHLDVCQIYHLPISKMFHLVQQGTSLTLGPRLNGSCNNIIFYQDENQRSFCPYHECSDWSASGALLLSSPSKKKKSRITWLWRIRHRESVYLFPGSLIQRPEMVARIIISILDGGGLVFCRPHSHLSPDLFDFLSALESGSGFQKQMIVGGRGRGTKICWVPSTSITYFVCENLSVTLQVNYFPLYSTERQLSFPQLNGLPKVTQIVRGGARIWIYSCQPFSVNHTASLHWSHNKGSL